MTENFRASWFENKETKVVKVPYSGAYSKDINNVFKLAFSTHDIKTVYYGIDIFHIFNKNVSSTRFELPQYLYDENILNDVKYLFNKDIFYQYTYYNIVNDILRKKIFNNDLAYNWNKNYKFGLEHVLINYERDISDSELTVDYYLSEYEGNMKNITEYIEKYPNTKFKIFFPPYSILFYKDKKEAIKMVTKKVVEDLLKYENVELYYFQNIEEIITNLDNYKDYSHYSEKINYYMYECMCETGKHRITKQNYKEEIDNLYNLVSRYDYDKILKN